MSEPSDLDTTTRTSDRNVKRAPASGSSLAADRGEPARRSSGTPAGHIAVTSLKRNGRMRTPVDYVHALELAEGYGRVFSTFRPAPDAPLPGNVDVTINVDPEDASPLDGAIGLLLPGGGDIDPDLYGSERHPRTRNVNRRRDRYEVTLLQEALARDMPVLCVCRGMQLLNVILGGTLIQNLADQPTRLEHDRDRPRADVAHEVKLSPDSIFTAIFDARTIGVNSHHHQGLERVAPSLEQAGWAEDGVLEAVTSRRHTWVVGVQWHPEVLAPVDHVQLKIFEAFVAATRAYAARVGIRPAARSA